MRAKKLLKIGAWTLGSLGVVLLCLVAFFLFNPFEGSLPSIRNVVPRGVDFYLRKADLAGDFVDARGVDRSADFPEVPALVELAKVDPGVQQLMRTRAYRDLGVARSLQQVRKALQELRKSTSMIDVLQDFLGQELQIAGKFSPRGLDGARWCAYARVSMTAKAAYGLAGHGMAREEFRKGGVVITDEALGDHSCYKIVPRGAPEPLYLMRHLDCLMLSNDKPLLAESHKLCLGSDVDVEPLGTSSHYITGVREPLKQWTKMVDFPDPNTLELFFRPSTLLSRLPAWRKWPDPDNEDRRNERILAAFFNPKSWMFLSGSLIFEHNSMSLLSRLAVNANLLSPFQKELFKGNAEPREKWMDSFFRMVPSTALGAAALRIPAGDFVTEMVERALDKDERDLLGQALRGTGKYKGYADLITRLAVDLQPRVGVVMRPNRRNQESVKAFAVKHKSPFPQWAMVFWVRKSGSRVRNEAFKDLIKLLNQHRGRFAIKEAFTLDLRSSADVAYEFAIPDIAGTGSVAICTYADYFIIGNSGPFIQEMTLSFGNVPGYRSVFATRDFEEFQKEMHKSVNGIAFLSGKRLEEVAEDFESFAGRSSGEVDPIFKRDNRPTAEQRVFNRSYRQYGSKARIPNDKKAAFDNAVIAEMTAMWRRSGQNTVISPDALASLEAWSKSFSAAFIQLVASPNSMDIWGRVLSAQYRH